MPNILIAEDERPIADLIRMTLKGAGYRCDWAPDGDRAADLAGAGTYDLALVDVMLPGSDGFALLEYCQTLDLPVIFVTARGAVADRVRGLHAGAEDYIVKPFDAATPTPPGTGTPSMKRWGAGSWPTAAKRWTSTSSASGKRWAGRKPCGPFTRWATGWRQNHELPLENRPVHGLPGLPAVWGGQLRADLPVLPNRLGPGGGSRPGLL